jgi:histidine triad (HIT) family protein
MGEAECTFCMIVEGTLNSYKIFEDHKFLAVLDTFPAVDGQTVILTKEHKHSYAFLLKDEEISEMVIFSKRVAKLLEKALKVERVQFIFAGTSVSHLHAKLYPTDKRITVGERLSRKNISNKSRIRLKDKD